MHTASSAVPKHHPRCSLSVDCFTVLVLQWAVVQPRPRPAPRRKQGLLRLARGLVLANLEVESSLVLGILKSALLDFLGVDKQKRILNPGTGPLEGLTLKPQKNFYRWVCLSRMLRLSTGLRSSARPPVHPLPPRGQPVAVASKFEKGNNNRNKFGRNDGVAGPSTATEICPPAHTRSQEDWTATTKTTTGDDEVL